MTKPPLRLAILLYLSKHPGQPYGRVAAAIGRPLQTTSVGIAVAHKAGFLESSIVTDLGLKEIDRLGRKRRARHCPTCSCTSIKMVRDSLRDWEILDAESKIYASECQVEHPELAVWIVKHRRRTYTVRSEPLSCTCPVYLRLARCWHVAMIARQHGIPIRE